MPGMQDTAVCLREGEIIAAAGRLVMRAADRDARHMAEQQRADRAMPDEQHVAGMLAGEDAFRLPHDARLSVDRPLPAANARHGLCEEGIRRCLEFGWRQEAGRRTVV